MRLRIIAGTLKGHFINAPNSKHTRPTTDRVRETLFNILNNIITFEGIRVLDLYAGSGSLGFESLSRGAKEVHFVEQNSSVAKNLEANIAKLGAENSCKIFKAQTLKFTSQIPDDKYDLLFTDPPFFRYDIYEVAKNLFRNNFLKKNGIIIVERSIVTKERDIENFNIRPFKIIGDACLYKLSAENKTTN